MDNVTVTLSILDSNAMNGESNGETNAEKGTTPLIDDAKKRGADWGGSSSENTTRSGLFLCRRQAVVCA